MLRPTIDDVRERMLSVSNVSIYCPKTENKGAVGHLLEDKLGIPRSSACLDCVDGEVKIVSLKKLKNGTIVPKETVAVTMLSKDSLRDESFEDSRCFKKMNRMLMIPYLREEDSVVFFNPTLITMSGELLELIRADYDAIRNEFIATGVLQTKTGKYLQNRTKGPGGEVKTRAYYLKVLFIKEFVAF